MPAKPTRVFIAEDSPSTRASLKAVLQKASDMEIVGESENGNTVLDNVAACKPEIVLMDIGMPGMDGLTATKRLKEKFPHIRVIMVTSNESDGVIFDAFSCGADGYYLKSNTLQLLQAVRSVHTGAAWLHPAIAGRVLRACVRGATRLMEKKQSDSGSVKGKISKNENLCRLVDLAGELESNSRIEDAEAVFTAAVAFAERLPGDRNIELASVATLYADLLYANEKFVEAENLYQKALELRHMALGQEHIDVASSLENLGNLYDTRSNYAEAEHFYFWSLKIREKLSGPDHPLTHETCSKLAWVYRAQGKYDLAEEMDKRCRVTK
ncbi:MAG: tetratricopeptide repeat protein [Candidatus Obscuribacterales bacterium]|nr:tetratricopeptide repeat protein [Candidatus Obscuribacterales bacterium]